MAKDGIWWNFSLETKERKGEHSVENNTEKTERKWEIIMSQNSTKDKSSNKMKSSSRPNVAEKHAIIALNTERYSQTLWE